MPSQDVIQKICKIWYLQGRTLEYLPILWILQAQQRVEDVHEYWLQPRHRAGPGAKSGPAQGGRWASIKSTSTK